MSASEVCMTRAVSVPFIAEVAVIFVFRLRTRILVVLEGGFSLEGMFGEGGLRGVGGRASSEGMSVNGESEALDMGVCWVTDSKETGTCRSTPLISQISYHSNDGFKRNIELVKRNLVTSGVLTPRLIEIQSGSKFLNLTRIPSYTPRNI
jgi:hypothetical protein